MERKINRVRRWLERCLKACKSRSWENALADMECASAELESARRELWSVVDGSRRTQRNRRYSKPLAVSLAAGVFVLAAAIPVAVPEPVKQAVSRISFDDERALLELVTRDEKALLASLRKSLSSASGGLDDPGGLAEAVPPEKTVPEKKYAAAPLIEIKAGQDRKMPENPRENSAPVRLDEMMQLIEIGQKALRGDQGLIVLEERRK